MNNSFYRFFIFWAGSFVCLYLAFSPCVNIPYASHDSIRYFHKFYNKVNQTNPLFNFLKAEGRLVGAELEELIYKDVSHLSDISRLRLIAIIIVALSASILAMLAQSAGMDAIPAFCLSTVIFTLPGVQDLIFAPYLYAIFAIFLSLLAYFILTKKMMYGVHFIATLVLLEMAFFMYPPETFLFLVPTMFFVVFHKNGQVLKKIWARDIFLWVIAAAIYYFILRIFFYAQIKSTSHEIAFTWKQVMFNTITFFTHGLPQIFNLWNVYYSKTLGIFMVILVAVFVTIDFFVAKKMGWNRLCALAIIFGVFNLIWFLFGGYMPREFIASQGLALALVYWCGEQLGNIGKRENGIFPRIWPVFFLCVGLMITNQMVTSNVLNNYSELMFMRSRLAQFVDSSTNEIHIIRLKDTTRGYNGLPRVYDNINSSAEYYEIPDLIRVALKDLADPFALHCIVTYSNYGESYKLLPKSVVIDMNDLVYISSSGQK